MVEAKATDNTETKPETEEQESWWTFQRWTILAVSIFFGIYLLIFLVGFISSLIWPEGAAGFFSYLRDLVSIGLSISVVAIVVAIGILIVQIARFVNLLRSEVKPIAEETKEAVKNIRVTTAFIQKHAISPIIQFQSFTAGLLAFLAELIKVTKLLQKRSDEEYESLEEDDE